MMKEKLRNELELLDRAKLEREARLAMRLNRFFRKLSKSIMKQLHEYYTEYGMDTEQFSILDYLDEYTTLIKNFDLKEFKNGVKVGERMTMIVNNQANKSKVKALFEAIDYWAPYKHTMKDLLQIVFIACERTLRRVDESIKQVIKDAYVTGEGIDYIAAKVQERFNQLKDWESVRIARTECHNAHNRGVVSAYTNYDVKYTMWISSHDNRVRQWKKGDKADHLRLDGEIIPIGGTYSNGLHYPGDISGPLYEFINCRCANAPYVVPPGYSAPPMSNFHEKDLIRL